MDASQDSGLPCYHVIRRHMKIQPARAEAETNLAIEGQLCLATSIVLACVLANDLIWTRFAEWVLLQRTCLKLYSTNYI